MRLKDFKAEVRRVRGVLAGKRMEDAITTIYYEGSKNFKKFMTYNKKVGVVNGADIATSLSDDEQDGLLKSLAELPVSFRVWELELLVTNIINDR